MSRWVPEPASFRDPSGFVFFVDGEPYRQVNQVFQQQFEDFRQSKLVDSLLEQGLILPFEEVEMTSPDPDRCFCILKHPRLAFVSYPYEWSFSQLKDAALTTLKIQRIAFESGFTLKDASAFNIQFHEGRPVLIDTLSFERWVEGAPWQAYRQFCEHFLVPLALIAECDPGLGRLSEIFIDGVPLELAARTLPAKLKWRPGLQLHIFAHANAQRKHADGITDRSKLKVTRNGLMGWLDHLQSTVERLRYRPEGTEWADYYQHTNYSSDAMQRKAETVETMIRETGVDCGTVWDLGANTGEFSVIAARQGHKVIAWDKDPAAVELHYGSIPTEFKTNITPLIQDFSNPTPAIGWRNQERKSFSDRGPADIGLALALIHHLAIGNNVPLSAIAEWFAEICTHIIVEFVPKSDSQVQRLLASRQDIYSGYDQGVFELAMGSRFELMAAVPIEGTERTMYRFKRRPA